jgi:hypothetical protein
MVPQLSTCVTTRRRARTIEKAQWAGNCARAVVVRKPDESKSPIHEAQCLRQQEIIHEIQGHLIRLAELAHAVASALENRNENLAHQIDREIELQLGAKERGMGKLEEHRKEHGC